MKVAIRRALAVLACSSFAACSGSSVRAADHGPTKVAILIFDGVEIIDYTGPYEVFGTEKYDVYTVAASEAPITTSMGMTVVPKYSYADAPPPDILVVPGGYTPKIRADEATQAWIRNTTATDRHTMSVCNGSFILAEAGLLDGLPATTTAKNLAVMQQRYPKVKVVGDQRVVDNGKILTTGGLSAGIDGALHVVAKLDGLAAAQEVALGLEYDWRPKDGIVRAMLADNLIPDLSEETSSERWTLLSTEGNRNSWHQVQHVQTGESAEALANSISRRLQTLAKWTLVSTSHDGQNLTTTWRFSGFSKPWTGKLRVAPGIAKPDGYTVNLNIARQG